MNKLNENYVYSLEELTSEQWELLKNHLPEKFKETKLKDVISTKYKNLAFSEGTWFHNNSFLKGIMVNAKELFYTLENVQVDCRELTEEQIKEMADIFEVNGFKIWDNTNALIKDNNLFLEVGMGDEVYLNYQKDNKTTITYSKFMKLFAPQYDVTMIVEAPKDHIPDVSKKVTEALYIDTDAEIKYFSEKPKHYAKGIDTFARMEANCTKEECIAFAKGNIDKYNFRTKGQDLEDFKKIIAYANWAIKLLENE